MKTMGKKMSLLERAKARKTKETAAKTESTRKATSARKKTTSAKKKDVVETKTRQRKPERDYEDFHKICPQCPKMGHEEITEAIGEEQISERFGWRTINERRIPQSWCKICRGKSSKKKAEPEQEKAETEKGKTTVRKRKKAAA